MRWGCSFIRQSQLLNAEDTEDTEDTEDAEENERLWGNDLREPLRGTLRLFQGLCVFPLVCSAKSA